jgi:flagellar protein FlaG
MSTDISGLGASRPPVPTATETKAAKVERPPVTLGSGKPNVEAVDKAPMIDPKEQMEKLQEAVERMNQQMQRNNYNLAFSVDQKANAIVIQVRNKETGDVIRQLPNEAALRFAHHLDDLRGLLQDKSV